MSLRYFTDAGKSYTRRIRRSDSGSLRRIPHTLFSESGIAWYRKQADDCREKVAHGPGLDSCYPVSSVLRGQRIRTPATPATNEARKIAILAAA